MGSFGGNDRFYGWMDRVESLLVVNFGFNTIDLPDCPYQDWYNGGVSPKQAVVRAIRNAREQGEI